MARRLYPATSAPAAAQCSTSGDELVDRIDFQIIPKAIQVRLRRGPQDAPRDIQVPLAPSGSRRVIPFAATVLRSLALLRYRSRASSHNDLTPLQGYRGLLASVFDLPWLVV